MEFEGVVYKIMPATKGVSARGEWQRQEKTAQKNYKEKTRNDDLKRCKVFVSVFGIRMHTIYPPFLSCFSTALILSLFVLKGYK